MHGPAFDLYSYLGPCLAALGAIVWWIVACLGCFVVGYIVGVWYMYHLNPGKDLRLPHHAALARLRTVKQYLSVGRTPKPPPVAPA
jgi:hypothetical protein